ncbi:unnamed protein product [Gadus morhua 'NCC']
MKNYKMKNYRMRNYKMKNYRMRNYKIQNYRMKNYEPGLRTNMGSSPGLPTWGRTRTLRRLEGRLRLPNHSFPGHSEEAPGPFSRPQLLQGELPLAGNTNIWQGNQGNSGWGSEPLEEGLR